MHKSLLFVIDSLYIGGAEKSLISLLNNLDSSKYKIDLLVFKRGGDFEKYVPKFINILESPEYFKFINKEKVSKNNQINYIFCKYKTSLSLRLNNIYFYKTLHSEQIVYKNIQKMISPIKKIYDVAIAYSQGMPTYFVANKVTSKKKLAWINTDYVNTLYDKEFDFNSYRKMNYIITVSNHINNSISKISEEYIGKSRIILDIIEPKIIFKMAQEKINSNYERSEINILTVGRLVSAKSYNLAIESAKLLKQHGYNFKWLVIGEGPEKRNLQKLIDSYGLSDDFILIGKKTNPYVYIKNCDIYVQTSKKEGYGLSVSEAKILKRPIVCTDFPTASEIIRHNIDGQIVKHDLNSIFNGIKKYIEDHHFRNKIQKELNSNIPYSTLDELNKFYELIEN